MYDMGTSTLDPSSGELPWMPMWTTLRATKSTTGRASRGFAYALSISLSLAYRKVCTSLLLVSKGSEPVQWTLQGCEREGGEGRSGQAGRRRRQVMKTHIAGDLFRVQYPVPLGEEGLEARVVLHD